MTKFIRLVLIISVTVIFTSSDIRAQLKWMTLEEAGAAIKRQPRPLLIDVYTDWCGWCKVMDKKTYTNKNVINYINDNFYAVKIDAETQQTITWNGKAYQFNQQYRTNDFAIFLTRGQLSYPTTVVIPVDQRPQAIPGYLEPRNMELILKYFGEGKYGKVAFKDYQEQFTGTW